MILTGFISWDQMSFCSALRKFKQRKEQWIFSELDKHRFKILHEIFINIAKEGQKEPIYRCQPPEPHCTWMTQSSVALDLVSEGC